jgi:NAD+ synthase
VAIGYEALEIDAEQVVAEITAGLREIVFRDLRRRGVVVGMSGGIDSSVTAALCARALGPERVLGVFMPERDSAKETLEISRAAAAAAGVETVLEDVTEILEAAGCYTRRDAASRSVVPGYGAGWKNKLVLPTVLGTDTLRVFWLVVEDPAGEQTRVRLPAAAYLEIVASTNFKQRARKMLEYFHADRLVYAVAGTPNRLEYDQGFFVKLGDGAADVKPIAHLFKTQVYALAAFLGLPDEVRSRRPTTDTYSLSQSQDEFYFSLEHERLDLCLHAHDQGLGPDSVAAAVGLSPEDVSRVFADIERKRQATRYLHLSPRLVHPVLAIDT